MGIPETYNLEAPLCIATRLNHTHVRLHVRLFVCQSLCSPSIRANYTYLAYRCQTDKWYRNKV